MIKVGDTYESNVAIYTVVRETRCKYFIKRVNKANHPCSPNKEFPLCGYWKKNFNVKHLKKVNITGVNQLS